MEELNIIWTEEETKAMAASTLAGSGGSFGGPIYGFTGDDTQIQDPVALLLTQSDQTVDEVWSRITATNEAPPPVETAATTVVEIKSDESETTLTAATTVVEIESDDSEMTLDITRLVDNTGLIQPSDLRLNVNQQRLVYSDQRMAFENPTNFGVYAGTGDHRLMPGGGGGGGTVRGGARNVAAKGLAAKELWPAKILQRWERRMAKNRESAARSRARKKAYTKEMEEEIAILKVENHKLRKKKHTMMMMAMEMEIQNQILAMKNGEPEPKKGCLRRTMTGPW